jgi:hypothetical protein
MAGYSIAAGHNYMAQKRTFAAAIQSLEEKGIQRENIDATWVFNGESSYGRFGSMTDPSDHWFKSRDYVVRLWLEPDHVQLRKYEVPYWSLWGWRDPDVIVQVPRAGPQRSQTHNGR